MRKMVTILGRWLPYEEDDYHMRKVVTFVSSFGSFVKSRQASEVASVLRNLFTSGKSPAGTPWFFIT